MVKWRDGTRIKADAELVWQELNSVTEKGLLPEDVVKRARDPDCELHKCFEWNDGAAAEQYRLSQARYLINHLVVEITDPEKKDVVMDVSYYTSIPAEVGRVYIPTIQAMAQPDLKQIVLREAVNLFKQGKEKLEAYNLLSRASNEMIKQIMRRLYRRMRKK